MPRALVVQTAFLGDVILATPLLAELATRGPVDVVTTMGGSTLLQGNPAVRRIIPFDKRGAARGVGGLLRLARDVRAEEASDSAFLAQRSIRSALLGLLAGYRRRVGFERSQGRLLYTERVPFDRTRHHAARLMGLSGRQENSPAALRPRLYPTTEDQAAVDALLADAGYDREPLVAMAPGSVWGTKRWPYYAELAPQLADFGRIVVVGGDEDRAAGRAVLEAAGTAGIDAVGRLGLLASAALIGRCRVLITNDSAPLHMASAMNTPTLAIFGPTVPSFGFSPLAARSAIAEVGDLPCRPCHSHGPMVCPLGHFRCMRDLSAVQVRTIVERLVRSGA